MFKRFLEKAISVIILLQLCFQCFSLEGRNAVELSRRDWRFPWWNFFSGWQQDRQLDPLPNPQPSLPNDSAPAGCPTIRVRREWNTFSRQEKINYIQAVKCLANSPSQLLSGGQYRRYDDFEYVHSRMRNHMHWRASFLPWHRHFIFLFEQALRNECQYSGSLPRWDWTLNSENIFQASVWSSDPEIGFGGNGRENMESIRTLNGSVVTDGAFARWPLYYPEFHLLHRGFNLPDRYKLPGRSWGSQFFDAPAIAQVQSQTSYALFAVALEGTDPNSRGKDNPGPHGIIHAIIGGDITPQVNAANEPLFYLHHANVDCQWYRWQNASHDRVNAYGGARTRGSTRNDARLTDVLRYLGLGDDIRVQDAMDTTQAPYCYNYA